MAIRQINATYVPAEDRIVLRVTVDEGDEYRFWLTRACLKGFAPQAVTWMAPPAPTPAATTQAFKREAAAAQADFSQPLTPGEKFPLGEAPVLVTRLQLESEGAAAKLQLHLADQRLVTLNLDEQAFAGIQRLLQQVVVSADWGLSTLAVMPAAAAGKIH